MDVNEQSSHAPDECADVFINMFIYRYVCCGRSAAIEHLRNVYEVSVATGSDLESHFAQINLFF